MTRPLTAQGVARSRRRTCARGIRASIWLSVSCVRATSPISRTNAAEPSKTLLNSGTMKPPRPSPPKIVDVLAADPGQVVGRRRRPLHLRPVVGRHLLGDPRRGHRQRHPAAAPLGRDQIEHDQQRAVVLDDPAALVDQREPLADRVEPHTERRPRGRHDLAEPHQARTAGASAVSVGPRLVEPGVDRQRVHAEPAEQAGQHEPGTAVGRRRRRPSGRPRRSRWCRRCAAATRCTSRRRWPGSAGHRSRRGTRGGTPAVRRPGRACADRPGTGPRPARRRT